METKRYWNKIRKKYPIAFRRLMDCHLTKEAWGTIDSPLIWGGYVDEEQYQLRHLYDFFDLFKLNMWVYTSDGKNWYFTILKKGQAIYGSTKKYKTRTQCEFFGWEKSFEILNKINFKNQK